MRQRKDTEIALNWQQHLTADGSWLQVVSAPADTISRPALFLDRDGVVVEDVHFLHKVEKLQVIEGAVDVIARARDADWYIVLVTNQSGIGSGYYDWPDFAMVHRALRQTLIHQGTDFHMVLACPHHPDGVGRYQHPNHPWRKPNPGMLQAAARVLPIDLRHSWIIGDRITDLQAGHRAGLAGGIHVLTGYGRNERTKVESGTWDRFEIEYVDNIGSTALILD